MAEISAVVEVAEAELAEVVGVEELLALVLKLGQTHRREPNVAVLAREGPAQGKAAGPSLDPAPSRATAHAPGSVARTLAPDRPQDLALN